MCVPIGWSASLIVIGRVEDRLERLSDVKALRLPADEDRHRRHLGRRLLGRVRGGNLGSLGGLRRLADTGHGIRFRRGLSLDGVELRLGLGDLRFRLGLGLLGPLFCGREGLRWRAPASASSALFICASARAFAFSARRTTLAARRLRRHAARRPTCLVRLPGCDLHLSLLGCGDRLQAFPGVSEEPSVAEHWHRRDAA